MAETSKRKRAGAARPAWDVVRNVTPDKVDLRDRGYSPTVAIAPPASYRTKTQLPVLDQGQTSACTGFSLANVVNHQLIRAGRAQEADVSPYMLYSMARRYDEFPGASEDTGSSLRGALKGWFRHGACGEALWDILDMPRVTNRAGTDWWLDAVTRPLGAYFRVEPRSVADMHVALNEAGVLYASAMTHGGWGEGFHLGKRRDWTIPLRARAPSDGGHAFVIVGYDRHGFLVHNSWGEGWGAKGVATLTYDDWYANAMDCWVAQLGVVTEEHVEASKATSPRELQGRTRLSASEVLRNHEIAPYVIDMENNGRLSGSGLFRTSQEDVRALVTEHLGAAVAKWGIPVGKPVDIAIYAHGGLVGEKGAAETAAKWIPELNDARLFPIFLMWETDLLSTLANRLSDLLSGEPRTTGGFRDKAKRWWDERLERLFAPLGTSIWGEMKQNADALSGAGQTGIELLRDECMASPVVQAHPLRVHLIAHSAGSIAHAFLLDRLAGTPGWTFASMSLMAPAIRVEAFDKLVVPHLKSGQLGKLNEFHLLDAAESSDDTMRPLLGYSRSLLYLVSQSFEGGAETPILGMERHFPARIAKMPQVSVFTAPSGDSDATTHPSFDDDPVTRATLLKLIRPK